MQFTKIDINNWTRKEYFDHYFDNTPCTYSMTVKLDISKLKKDGKKFENCKCKLDTCTVEIS